MSDDFPINIYHNPTAERSSRNVKEDGEVVVPPARR